MSLKKLDRIPGISRELVEQMRSKNILTAKDLLGLSILDAMETLDLSLAQLNNLRVRVSLFCHRYLNYKALILVHSYVT